MERSDPGDMRPAADGMRSDSRDVKFVTVCNDAFVPGLTVLLSSLRDHFDGFRDLDFEVLHHPEMTPLAAETRAVLAAEFPNLVFVEVDPAPYRGAPRVNRKADNSAYLTLEAFRPDGRERVIFIDADMLVLRDFSDVLHIDHPFIACQTGGHPKPYRGTTVTKGMVNTGLLVLGRPYLDGRAFRELLALVEANESDTIRDQAIINEYVPIDRVHVLPDTYNFQAFQHLAHFATLSEELRILHFSGYWYRPKPWEESASLERLAYRIWAESAVDAVRRAPRLKPLIPRFDEILERLEEVGTATTTGLGILRGLAADVEEDRRAEHHVYGDTTLNRVRRSTPRWVAEAARRLFGGTEGRGN